MTERVRDEGSDGERTTRRPRRPNLKAAPFDADADSDPAALTSAVAVRRQGAQAWIRVTGQITALTRRHLDDWLDWLITTGAARVTVSLATADQIDESCLLVLRVAQSRLRAREGELLVTAGRAQVRAALSSTTTTTRSWRTARHGRWSPVPAEATGEALG